MQVNPATASLYIANPLSGRGMAALFSTHPPIPAGSPASTRTTRPRPLRDSTGRSARPRTDSPTTGAE